MPGFGVTIRGLRGWEWPGACHYLCLLEWSAVHTDCHGAAIPPARFYPTVALCPAWHSSASRAGFLMVLTASQLPELMQVLYHCWSQPGLILPLWPHYALGSLLPWFLWVSCGQGSLHIPPSRPSRTTCCVPVTSQLTRQEVFIRTRIGWGLQLVGGVSHAVLPTYPSPHACVVSGVHVDASKWCSRPCSVLIRYREKFELTFFCKLSKSRNIPLLKNSQITVISWDITIIIILISHEITRKTNKKKH